MHALNLLDLPQQSESGIKQGIDSLITKQLLEAVQKNEVKRWNHKIESMVIKKMLPDLIERFSCVQQTEDYIKKSIERAVKHVKLLYSQKGAVTQNGQINVPLMIQNCIETKKLQSTEEAYEHALLEAKTLCAFFRPSHDHESVEERVAKAIFSLEQHACAIKGAKTPFEKLDPIDYLILQQQLDALCSYSVVSFDELKGQILKQLKTLQEIANMEHLPVLIAAIHARHLSHAIDFEKRWGENSVGALGQFILKQLQLHPNIHPIELVNRIVFLYQVSCQKEKKKELVNAAKDYLTSLSKDLYSPSLRGLGHEVYAFINHEIRKIKSTRPLTTLKEILKEVQQMFSFVDEIVAIPAHEKDFLEVFIFDHFYSYHSLMNQLNDSQKQLIAQYLSRVALEVGEKDFRGSVHTTYDRLVRYKNLNVPISKDASFFDEETLMDKIAHFSSQNELVLDQFKIPVDHPLVKIIRKSIFKEDALTLNVTEVELILKKFFKDHPLLTAYEKFYEKEVVFYHKALWYNPTKKGQKPALERFYQWHYELLRKANPELKGRELIKKMEEVTTKTLPLLPAI